ncbi:MAG: sialate O-acetylesterase [Tannerella sp.]|jgi:sialate O-acetylesterase|nr:sialate O-acetylesterase [Tannerella sp.]
MKTMKQLCVYALAAVALFGLQAQADIKLPAVFGDNMVLQQQSEVAVWGWAKPGAAVHVTGSWDGKSHSAQSGRNGFWKVKVRTPAAGHTPYTLKISDGKAVTLRNILIGEVWICSGQSNMEMPMKGWANQPVEGAPEAIAHSANRSIRCFTLQKASKATPQDDCTGTWEVAGPQTTPDFTATGYFFARFLNEALDVPVGLIHTSWGGSRIEAWMTPAALKDIPGKPVPATDEDIKSSNGTPTVLYNGMIHPIVGYGIRGAIWYQGESNRDEPALYAGMFDKMVREWRNLWDAGDFPFYYCQIAPYRYGDHLNSGYLREAQAKGMTTTPNTGMAVLTDAQSLDCIHPPKKKDAGERMALWALARTYGWEKMQYRSPELKSFETEGRVAMLDFDYAGSSGLTSCGREILNFRVAGEDKRFYPAKAAINGNRVYVFSPFVAKPVAVRYCFDDTSETEIFTLDGNLPLSSFRTDSW